MGNFFRTPAAPPGRHGAAALAVAAATMGLLLSAQVQNTGLVGEVAVTWSAHRPQALLALGPPVGTERPEPGGEAAVRRGPLRWGPTRPTLRLGGWPLMVNAYTGALPDLPAVIAARLGATEGALRWALRGAAALLTLGVGRALWRAGAPLAAGITALLLATRWDLQVYRVWLGGTELALVLAAGALCAAMLQPGPRGRAWVAAGLMIGLHAKITFVASACGLLLGGALAGALPRGWARAALLGAGLGLAPAALAAALELGPGAALPHLPSHDRIDLQLGRVWAALRGEAPGAREAAPTLWRALTDPSAFLADAYQLPPSARPPPLAAALGLCGWIFAGIGALAPGAGGLRPADRLRRALHLGLPLQLTLLWAFAHDLHHLAQAAVPAALWAGLCLARLARRAGPASWLVAVALGTPAAGSGALALLQTDALLDAAPGPMVSARGQREVAALLRAAGAQRVVLCDYEAWGSLDPLVPEVELRHAWPAAATGAPGLSAALLGEAQGGHLLTLRASAPFIYNWSAEGPALEAAAAELGLRVRPVGALPGRRAALWAVERAP
jgi:hypothetical protein